MYRAEAIRRHHERASTWNGKWRKDIAQAIAQAKRWQMKEPTANICVVSDNGMRATLDEVQRALGMPDLAATGSTETAPP